MKDIVKKYCFFIRDCGGGVTTAVTNIIKFGYNSSCDFRVVAIFERNSQLERLNDPISNAAIVKFEFSNLQNTYYILKRLSKCIPDESTILVANDGMELKMCALFNLPNPLVYILHGNYDYYFDLALLYEPIINKFITVSSVMKDKLIKLIPTRAADVEYFPCPIPDMEYNEITNNEILDILFVGRLTEEKGVNDLPRIDEILILNNCDVKWTLIGEGNNPVIDNWTEKNKNVTLLRKLAYSELLKVYSNFDLIILPSRYEGFPLVIAEGMKAGLVPMVSNLETIVKLIDNETIGYTFPIGDFEAYARKIIYLNTNRDILLGIKNNCRKAAMDMFNPLQSASGFLSAFNKAASGGFVKKEIKNIFMSRLDRRWIPDKLTYAIRKAKAGLSNLP